jgi:hypothetical protein
MLFTSGLSGDLCFLYSHTVSQVSVREHRDDTDLCSRPDALERHEREVCGEQRLFVYLLSSNLCSRSPNLLPPVIIEDKT